MFRSVIITFLLHNSFAKVYHEDPNGELAGFRDLDNRYYNYRPGSIIGDPLWVIRFKNDWLDPKLQLGTSEEQGDFYEAIGYLEKFPPRVKKDDPNKPKPAPQPNDNRSNADLKKEIMKMINKFALTSRSEPDSYLTENYRENDPSITLYFKGPFTCLIVKLGNKEWHYLIRTSPFPSWFSEHHDTFEAPLAIPEDIKNTFYLSLLSLLKTILNHPL